MTARQRRRRARSASRTSASRTGPGRPSNSADATPPQNATRELLPHLPNGHQVVLAGLGHADDFWAYEPDASTHLIDTYLDSGRVLEQTDVAGVRGPVGAVRGQGGHPVLRGLGARWTRIMWRCW